MIHLQQDIFQIQQTFCLQQSENLSLLNVDEMKLNIEQLASEANAYFGLYNEFWISQISIESIFNNNVVGW